MTEEEANELREFLVALEDNYPQCKNLIAVARDTLIEHDNCLDEL